MDQLRTEILRYVKLIVERRYLFVLSSLFIMSCIVWGSYFIPKQYEAKSSILIEKNVIEELVKGIAITPSMDERIRVLRETMLSRTLVLNVLRKLDLDSRAENDAALEKMINDFQEKTDLDVKKGRLVTVSFRSTDPQGARDYVNALVNEYVEGNIFAKREEAYDATKFLEKQVHFFKEKMDKGEDAIIKFRQEQGIYVAMDERSLIDAIKDHNEQIEDIHLKINELTATRDSIKKQLEDEDPFTVSVYSKKNLEGVIESLENKLRQLLINYTDNYPEVIRIRAQIEALKGQNENEAGSFDAVNDDSNSEISTANPVYQDLKQKVIETEAEIEALHAKEKHLKTLITQKEKILKDIPENEKKLTDLIKERDSFKSVYRNLLMRLGQSEVSKQMEIEDKATTFRIIEPAILPKIPVSPNRVKMILAGIFVGFLGGFGILLFLDYTDNSVKTLDALKSLGLPVFAIIPRMQSTEETIQRKKKDTYLFGFAGIYMFCILVVLAMEVLNIKYIENLISRIL
jgi:succinoglycan biosynthesis transport protein ExoP